jgi:hypothetical protein
MARGGNLPVGARESGVLGAGAVEPKPPLPYCQAPKQRISSAPEFCTENSLIFQCLGFGTKLLDAVEKLEKRAIAKTRPNRVESEHPC